MERQDYIERSTDIAALLRSVVETTYEEQEYIGKLIHGEICGLLSVVKLEINKQRRVREAELMEEQSGKELAGLNDTIIYLNEIFDSLKVISRKLNPAQVKNLGLIRSLEMYNKEMQANCNMHIQLINASQYEKHLPLEYATERKVYTLYKRVLRYFADFVDCSSLQIILNNNEESISIEFINEFPSKVTENEKFPFSPELAKHLNLIEAMLMVSGATIDENSDLINSMRLCIPISKERQ